MSKILVARGAGYVGQALAPKFRRNGHLNVGLATC